MKIKARIKPIYIVEKDGEVIGEFEEVSSWEGMVKLKSDKGIIIAGRCEDPSIFQAFFDGMVTTPKESEELLVIKATAGLLKEDL